jgi:hypothetical protein
VTTNGTTYVHRDLGEDIRRGGFHLGPTIAAVTSSCLTWFGVAAYWACHAGAQLCALAGGLALVTKGNVAVRSFAASLCCCLPIVAVSWCVNSRRAVVPGFLASYTVSVCPGWSMFHRGQQLAQVYTFRRTPLHVLEARAMSQPVVRVKVATEVAASLALVKDPQKAEAGALAMCFRAGLSPEEAGSTIAAAKVYREVAANTDLSGNGFGQPAPPDPGINLASSVWDHLLGTAWRTLPPLTAAFSLGIALGSACSLRVVPPLARATAASATLTCSAFLDRTSLLCQHFVTQAVPVLATALRCLESCLPTRPW